MALAVLARQTWNGAWWARWAIAAVLVGTRIVYARELVEAVRQSAGDAAVTVALLVVDVVVLVLLFSRAARTAPRSARPSPAGPCGPSAAASPARRPRR